MPQTEDLGGACTCADPQCLEHRQCREAKVEGLKTELCRLLGDLMLTAGPETSVLLLHATAARIESMGKRLGRWNEPLYAALRERTQAGRSMES